MSDAKDAIKTSDITIKGNEIKQVLSSKDIGNKRDNKLREKFMCKEHKMTVEEALKYHGHTGNVDTDVAAGLSDQQVSESLAKHGENTLTPPPETPWWFKLIEKIFLDFFAMLLWVGSILCFISYSVRNDLDNLALGTTLAVVVTLTGIFSYFQDKKSGDLMKQFSGMGEKAIVTIRNGQEKKLPPSQLVPGDIIKLISGMKIPADIRVLKSEKFKVNNSALTGEPDALLRTSETSQEQNPMEAKNLAFFGTLCEEGNVTGLVFKTGDNSAMGLIAALTLQTKNEETPIAKEIHYFVLVVSGVAIFLGVSFLIVGLVKGTEPMTAIVFMIGIIVANVPEGLLATLTICLSLTAQRMSEKQVLVKNMESVETLGSTSAICSDKTGTLTQNKMTVMEIVYGAEIHKCETPACQYYEDFWKSKRFDYGFQQLCTIGAVCNDGKFIIDTDKNPNPPFRPQAPFGESFIWSMDAETGCWSIDGNATDVAILKFCQDKAIYPKAYCTANSGASRADEDKSQSLNNAKENRDETSTNGGKVQEWGSKKLQEQFPVRTYKDPNSDQVERWRMAFNSRNKFQVSVHHCPVNKDDPLLFMKGAPDILLSRSDKFIDLDGTEKPMTEADLKRFSDLNDELAREGRRVIAFCQKYLPADTYGDNYKFNTDKDMWNFPLGVSEKYYEEFCASKQGASEKCKEKLTFVGLMALIDPPKPGVREAVQKCRSANIKVAMVTGDHPKTAKAIAKEVMIILPGDKTTEDIIEDNEKKGVKKGDLGYTDPALATAVVIHGMEFDSNMPVEFWADVINNFDSIVFARTSPQQKLQIVKAFQEVGEHIVAVTGDGVNDAPALKKADIGIAMGIMGTDVSKAAADMHLTDDNFASIVKGVEEGRLIFDNLKKSIAYTLSSNIPEISPFLAYITLDIPLALSTVLILLVDLGTDMVPAISMAWENAEADIMRRKPRDAKRDRLVTRKLVNFAYLQIGVIQCIAGFFSYLTILNDYGYPPHILPGLNKDDEWGRHPMYCKLSGGTLRNLAGAVCPTMPLDTSTEANVQAYRNCFQDGYLFWDPTTGAQETVPGQVIGCNYAPRNLIGGGSVTPTWDISKVSTFTDYTAGFAVSSVESMAAMNVAGYVEYLPWRGRLSEFFDARWLSYDITQVSTARSIPATGNSVAITYFLNAPSIPMSYSNDTAKTTTTKLAKPTRTSNIVSGLSVGGSALGDYVYSSTSMSPVVGTVNFNGGSTSQTNGKDGTIAARMHAFYDASGTNVKANVANRMMQKEALHHAQTGGFVNIIVVQWADLMICKTRFLSIRQQGMVNPVMNFGLLFETILGSMFCYMPGLSLVGTRPLRFSHWLSGVPFFCFIFGYDELRKAIMRMTSPVNPKTSLRNPGWLERNTYY